MSPLQGLCDAILADLWRNSWQIAALTLAVTIVQALLGRWLTPRWRYGLWLVVAARLALPVTLELPGALVDWADRASDPRPATAVVAAIPNGRRTAELPPYPPRQSPLEGTGLPPGEGAIDPAAAVTRRRVAGGRAPAMGTSAPAGPILRAADEPGPPAEVRVPWRPLLLATWLAGIAVAALRLLIRERRFRRRLVSEPRLEDARVGRLVAECAASLGLKRPVRVIVTDLAGSPAAQGFWHPTLLLPGRLLGGFSPAELRGVFLHELAHLRRGDALLGGALAGLRVLYWFHPLVHLALARLRGAQECLRDWEALSASSSPAPLTYAKTLLRLLEREPEGPRPALAAGLLHRGRDTERRILMIASFGANRPERRALGLGLCLILGWASFTTAAPESARSSSPPGELGTQAQEITFERHLPPPEWLAPLQAKLDRTTVECAFENATIEDLADFLRSTLEVNLLVDPELIDALGGDELGLVVGSLRASSFLDFICSNLDPDVDWCLTRGLIYIGWRHQLPEPLDLRFYRVQPLLETGAQLDEVAVMVQAYTGDCGQAWEFEGVTLEAYGELLVIRQSDRVHAQVLALLQRMLHRGARVEAQPEPWELEIRERLERTRGDIEFVDLPLSDAVAALSEMSGVPIRIEDQELAEELISLELAGLSAAEILDWIAYQSGLHVRLEGRTILLSETPSFDLEFHELEGLLERYDADELIDWVADLIRVHIAPAFWDEHIEASIHLWNGLLVVNATPEIQAEIDQLLAALLRASR